MSIDTPVQVPETTTAEKVLRYAKAHVAVIGAVLIFAEQNIPLGADVKHWLAFAIGLLTAAGVIVVPNAPSQAQREIEAHAMAVQTQNPPEDPSVDVSAPIAPAGLPAGLPDVQATGLPDAPATDAIDYGAIDYGALANAATETAGSTPAPRHAAPEVP